MKQELGISFRSERRTMPVIRETAERYGFGQADFLGVYDDLGDLPPVLPLFEAATHLPEGSQTRVGAVGFAVPKHPSMVDVAGYAASLQAVLQDPKRLVVGLVPGAWMDQIGLKEASVGQMREAAGSLKHLMEQRTQGYDGQHYQIKPGFQTNYETAGMSPLLIGAIGPRMAALAGEIADEVKTGGLVGPHMVDIVRDRMRVGAEKAGRDVNNIRIALGAVTIVDEDGTLAKQQAKRKAAVYISVIGDKDPKAMADFPEEVRAIKQAMSRGDVDEAIRYLPDELLSNFVIAGTPAEVIKQVEKMLEAGADRIEFGTPHGIGDSSEDEMKGIDLIAKKVIPYFR